MIISCFFCEFVGEQIHRYADTQIGVPAMISNQLHEVIVGFADPPHPQRMSKLSRKYWHDKHQLKQESMPVIPVDPNHPAASAAHKRTPSVAISELPAASAARKRTPSAAICKSPPRAAKGRANNALMHVASASAPPCHLWPQLLLPLLLRTLVMPLVSLLFMPSLPPP
jgi:hypothetical protein